MKKLLLSKEGLDLMGFVLAMYLSFCAILSLAVLGGAHTGTYMPFWHWPIKLLTLME